MRSIEELEKILNISENRIEKFDNIDYVQFLASIKLNDKKSLKYYFNRLYKNNESEYKGILGIMSYLLYNEKININYLYNKSENYLFINSLLKNRYHLAKEVITIASLPNEIEKECLISYLGHLEDNLEYITAENFEDKEVKERIKELERKLIVYLKTEHPVKFADTLDELMLIDIYNRQYYRNINSLLSKAAELQTKHHLISKHSDGLLAGKIDIVVGELLKRNDLYRLNEVINSVNQENNIKMIIYKHLNDVIMYLNEKNKKYVDLISETNTSVINPNEALRNTNLVTLKNNMFNYEAQENTPRFNFYSLYQEELAQGNIDAALKNLLKFKHHLDHEHIYKDFSYLLSELEYYKEHEDKYDKEYFIKLNKASELIDENKYEEAEEILYSLSNYYFNPKLHAMLGLTNHKKGIDYVAYEYYTEASKYYLNPDIILDYLELLYKYKNYSGIVHFGKLYNQAYPEENNKVYYLLSIAYINLGRYDDALDCIKLIESINVVYYNLAIEYINERNIINKLKQGANIKPYTLDDFVDFAFNQDEESLCTSIDNYDQESIIENVKAINTKASNKVIYLLSIIKIFISCETEFDLLIKYADELISEIEDTKEKSNFTKVLKNYKNL